MVSIPLALLGLVSFLCTASASDIQGKIQWTELCPGPGDLGAAKILLNDGRISAGVTHDGSFFIPDVAVGTYVLSVLARNHVFDQLRIDVLSNSSVPEVRPFVVGTPLDPPPPVLLTHPVVLMARQKNDYFVPRESFNLIAMFQNPMMLIMVVGAVLVLVMPYVMQNLDPEILQEVQNRQRGVKMGGMQNLARNGDVTSGHAAVASEDGISSSTRPRNRGAKNKRR